MKQGSLVECQTDFDPRIEMVPHRAYRGFIGVLDCDPFLSKDADVMCIKVDGIKIYIPGYHDCDFVASFWKEVQPPMTTEEIEQLCNEIVLVGGQD